MINRKVYRYADGTSRKQTSGKKNGLDDSFARSIYDSSGNEENHIQTKMDISQPGDASEQQADQFADAVLNGNPEKSQGVLSETAEDISRMADGPQTEPTDELNEFVTKNSGLGEEIPEEILYGLEEHSGEDLSDVRLHTDPISNATADRLNAKAFTHGRDIYFGEGEFDLESREGIMLFTHEIAHTIQQGKNGTSVQRAMKLEFQTGNYIWNVKPGSAAPLDRKFGESGATEDGDKPAYLTTGVHGEPARKKVKANSYISLKSGPTVLKETKPKDRFPFIEANGPSFDPLRPAEFVIPVLVKNMHVHRTSGKIPPAEDIIELPARTRSGSIMLPGYLPKGQYNEATIEYKYYDYSRFLKDVPMVGELIWNDEWLMYENSAEYFRNKENMKTLIFTDKSYLTVHRDKQGIFREGHVPQMMEIKAQFIHEYQFTEQVNIESILNKPVGDPPVGAGNIRSLSSIDNSTVLSADSFYANTYEYIFFNVDGRRMDIHLDQYGKFQLGHVRLMEQGPQDLEGTLEGRKAQYQVDVLISGITNQSQLLGKTVEELTEEITGFAIKEEVKDLSMTSTNLKDNYIPNVYSFYYLSDDLEKFYNVHRDSYGRFQSGTVQYLQRTDTDIKKKEQTAMELQSETGGFIEFETPKWFQRWSELKLRVSDAIAMIRKIHSAKTLADDDPISIKIKKRIPKLVAAGLRRASDSDTEKRKSRIVEWPFDTSHLPLGGGKLYAEIVDNMWGARIQVSEEILMSQYESLLEEHEDDEDYIAAYKAAYPDEKGTMTEFQDLTKKNGQKVWTKVVEYLANESVKNDSLLFGKNETDLADLRGFVFMVVNYLLRGQGTNLKGDPAKFGFQLLSRTSFYSIYHSILDASEQLIFKYLVDNNIFIQEMRDALNALLKSHYKVEDQGKVWVTKYSLLFFNGYGHGTHADGPTIQSWLDSIISGGGYDYTNKTRKTDKISPLPHGSLSMGRFDVETDPGKKDTNLVKFEIRESSTHTFSGYVPVTKWLTYTEEVFKSAWEKRGRNATDDITTTDKNETDPTALIYDP